MLAEKNKAIQEASAHLHILTKDEKIRLQCEAREMYEHDIATIRNEGRAEGREEGREEGRSEVNQLTTYLIRDGRMDDLMRSVSDEAYQEQLMREYGIIPAENQ